MNLIGLHPEKNLIVDLSEFKALRKCNVNPTHIDFYREVPLKNERGTPDLTWEYKSEYQRDEAFNQLGQSVYS